MAQWVKALAVQDGQTEFGSLEFNIKASHGSVNICNPHGILVEERELQKVVGLYTHTHTHTSASIKK